MNQLSWLLYLSDVAGNVGVVGVLGAIGCGVGGLVCVIAGGIARAEADDSWNAGKDLEGKGAALQRKAVSFVAPAIALAVMTAAVPSRNTVMMIAASEVGETVLASKDVQDIGGEAGALATDSLKLLRKYVTEQLAGADAK